MHGTGQLVRPNNTEKHGGGGMVGGKHGKKPDVLLFIELRHHRGRELSSERIKF